LKLNRRDFLKGMAALGIIPTLDPWKGIEAYFNPERKSFLIRNKNLRAISDQVFMTLEEKLRFSKKGIYHLAARVVFDPNLKGRRILQIMKGNQVLAMRDQKAETDHPKGLPMNKLNVNVIVSATEEEIIRMRVYQNSGQNLQLEESRIGGWRVE